MSDYLAEVKQNTTKGLWAQMTSQFSDSFLQAFEMLEPKIKYILKNFIEKFKAPEFAKGIAQIGTAILDLVSFLGKIGTWFANNFYWLEPFILTYMVSSRLFKFAGALTDIGVALGYIGKQSKAIDVLRYAPELISSMKDTPFVSATNMRNAKKTTSKTLPKIKKMAGEGFAVGVGAKAGTKLVESAGLKGWIAGGAAGGEMGKAATGVAALGGSALAFVGIIATLIGGVGVLLYKAHQAEQATKAIFEDLESSKKYRYGSIDELNKRLKLTYDAATKAKGEINELLEGKSLEDATGIKIGRGSSNWFKALFAPLGYSRYGMQPEDIYTFNDAYQQDISDAIYVYSERKGSEIYKSAVAKLGELDDPLQVKSFMDTAREVYGVPETQINKDLFVLDKDNNPIKNKHGLNVYKKVKGKVDLAFATSTPDYVDYINKEIIDNDLLTIATKYRDILKGKGNEGFENIKFDFGIFAEHGYFPNEQGILTRAILKPDATEEERKKVYDSSNLLTKAVSEFTKSLMETFHDEGIVTNILKSRGIPDYMYANNPLNKDSNPWDASGITNEDDDLNSGGSYGKSSAAPKQVIVSISNLLSVQTIQLMNTNEGKHPEIQDLKEQMAQALIDVVHDFDASWNG